MRLEKFIASVTGTFTVKIFFPSKRKKHVTTVIKKQVVLAHEDLCWDMAIVSSSCFITLYSSNPYRLVNAAYAVLESACKK
jgi:hypothetical protein